MKENTLKFAINPRELEAYKDTIVSEIDTTVSEIDTLESDVTLFKFD